MDYRKILDSLSAAEKLSNKRWVQKTKKHPPADLDHRAVESEQSAFSHIDCLKCANCCSTTSPILYRRDVERLSDHFGIRPGVFTEKFLRTDEDGDQVLSSLPCPFLGADKRCSVYECRPAACREYPHINRKKFHEVLDLALKNTAVCPAVVEVMRDLRREGGN
ncbi:MAG: YkgJ family cysteine cluster protein [Bacteroidia bacterium]|nr:YkgJ family cysteine cluster protein [Bacteroidia bacterium]